MASGNTLLILSAASSFPTITGSAELTAFSGYSVPAESIVLANFDSTTTEYLDWSNLVMPSAYSNGGLTMTLRWMSASVTTGAVVWGAALRRDADDAENWASAHTYNFNDSLSGSAPTVLGETSYDNITFTDGADMDSVVAGEGFNLRVRRSVDNAGDNMIGDARLWTVTIKET